MYQYWTIREEQFLKRNYSIFTNAEIQKNIQKPIPAIQRKAIRLGLKKNIKLTRMAKLTEGQKAILKYFDSDFEKELTTAYFIEQIAGGYYGNSGARYVGQRLSRLVNSGHLQRVKKGVFKLGNGKPKAKETPIIKNQQTLF